MHQQTKLITHDGKYTPEELTYLDLTDLNIITIENLNACQNLTHLILRHNNLNSLFGLENCKELWRLDVNNNSIKNLDGLSKFVALGTLNLHANQFTWNELEKIRHLHIVDLVISSNAKLDNDPNCRRHLIDSLPNVWMIDGLLVTSVERLQVTEFFEESALTSRPVRSKLPKYRFTPTELKKRDTFGIWSTNLLRKFPVNETKNIETDLRRLEFIASWFEDIILSECRNIDENSSNISHGEEEILVSTLVEKGFLKDLLNYRKENTEMCNMTLLLLIASIQFDMPIDFIRETLVFTNLNEINESLEAIKLFQLPKFCRIYIANLLLSAVKIDRDQNMDAGFYENLFVSLRNIIFGLFSSFNDDPNICNEENYYDFSDRLSVNSFTSSSPKLKENISLLSTEIIQLFCIVPSFYDYLLNSQGLITILNMSIGDGRIYQAILNLLQDLRNTNISEEMGTFITNILKLNARQSINKKTKRVKTATSFLSSRSHYGSTSSIHSATATVGRSTPHSRLGLNTLADSQNSHINNNPSNNNNNKQNVSSSSPASFLITSPLSIQQSNRKNSSNFYINKNVEQSTIKNGRSSPEQTKKFNKIDLYFNNNQEEPKKFANHEESIIIGRKMLGKIIHIDEDDVAIVKFDDSIDLSDFCNDPFDVVNENNLLLIDLKNFIWDGSKKFWRPYKSTGDVNTFSYDGDIKRLILNPVIDELMSARHPSVPTGVNNSINLAFSIESEYPKNTVKTGKTLNSQDNSVLSSATTIRPSIQAGSKLNNLAQEISNNIDGTSHRALVQLPTKQPTLILNSNSPISNAPSPTITHRNFPGNKLLRSQHSMSASTLLGEKLNKKYQESFQKPSKTTPNIVSSGFVQTWTCANMNFLNSSESNQINYGPTISAANLNGSNYVINSVLTNNINNTKTNNFNGPISSSTNSATYRGSAGTIYQKPALNLNNNNDGNSNKNEITDQSTTANNIHLKLPSNINNLTLKNNTSQNFNENIQFIDPINDTESVSDSEYIKSSIENNKKLIENLMLDPNYQALQNVHNLSHKEASVSDCNNCIHCKLEANEVLLSSMNGESSTLKKLAHSNIMSSATSKYYQAFSNFFKNANETSNNMNSGKIESNHFKKLIKIQDCTTWLTMSNSVKNSSNVSNKSLSANSVTRTQHGVNSQQIQNKMTNQNFTGYKIIDPNYNHANRISLLLNRKISRSNTKPKTPNLTSPSSKAHMMNQGLRPNSMKFGRDINLTSTKLEISKT